MIIRGDFNWFIGLSTALVERDDFASGTSSRSTKLIHGGVRYLQKAIMQLDREQVICMLSAKIYFHWIMQEDNLSIFILLAAFFAPVFRLLIYPM